MEIDCSGLEGVGVAEVHGDYEACAGVKGADDIDPPMFHQMGIL